MLGLEYKRLNHVFAHQSRKNERREEQRSHITDSLLKPSLIADCHWFILILLLMILIIFFPQDHKRRGRKWSSKGILFEREHLSLLVINLNSTAIQLLMITMSDTLKRSGVRISNVNHAPYLSGSFFLLLLRSNILI